MPVRSLKRHLLRPLKRLLDDFDLRSGRLQAVLDLRAEAIGHRGAAEAFASYLTSAPPHDDPALRDFMAFYAERWPLSRSQWSQDVFVMHATGLKERGRYLEIGGADGITHSNTYSLSRHLDWTGVLVEPDADMFRILRAVRGRRDEVLRTAISPTGSSGVGALRKAGQLSALRGHEGDDLHAAARSSTRTFEAVATVSMTEVLRRAGALDYLSLDVEGAEPDILESVAWREVAKPRVITVEHNFRASDAERMRRVLGEQGYREVFAGQDWLRRGDLWMVLEDEQPQAGRAGAEGCRQAVPGA